MCCVATSATLLTWQHSTCLSKAQGWHCCKQPCLSKWSMLPCGHCWQQFRAPENHRAGASQPASGSPVCPGVLTPGLLLRMSCRQHNSCKHLHATTAPAGSRTYNEGRKGGMDVEKGRVRSYGKLHHFTHSTHDSRWGTQPSHTHAAVEGCQLGRFRVEA